MRPDSSPDDKGSYFRSDDIAATEPPFANGDESPDTFDNSERPSTLQESIRRAHPASAGEDQSEPARAVLQRIEHEHQRYGNEAEQTSGNPSRRGGKARSP
jgi:hypothetical protein